MTDFGTLCIWLASALSKYRYLGFRYFHFRHHPGTHGVARQRRPVAAPRACPIWRGTRSRKGNCTWLAVIFRFKQRERERKRVGVLWERRSLAPADCSFFEGGYLSHPPRAPSARFPSNLLPFFPPLGAPLSVPGIDVYLLRDATGPSFVDA